jgi:hypothetical protein
MQFLVRLGRNFVQVLVYVLRWLGGFVSRRRLFVGFSLVALTFLSSTYGAASLYFNLPPSLYLLSAFRGFEAWLQHGDPKPVVSRAGSTQLGVSVDDPTKAYEGFTLYTTTQGTSAALIDMRGQRVHKWSRSFSEVWPKPAHVKHKVADDLIHWFRTRLFPNGDLLAIYQTDSDTPHGYGLAKLDKDSKLLWAYADNVHHDLDMGDDGRIYTLVHHISTERLKGLPYIVPPYLADYLVILSPDGQELEKISLLEALQNSPFALLLASVTAGGLGQTSGPQMMPMPMPGRASPGGGPGKPAAPRPSPLMMQPSSKEFGDVLHANSVRVLKRALAAKFPHFKEGQVLISLCDLNTLVVLDVPSRSIVWAAQGVWQAQHDAEFLENGHLLLFDNAGQTQNSRVVEFDPITQSYPWSYANENTPMFFASHRGMKQRLPNGNVLIVDPDDGRLFEVTSTKELVWQFGCPAEGQVTNAHAFVTGAWRYPAAELNFLDKVAARPR